ncbi:hypothetical protein GCM10017083_43810 [Thalassobaculum fulvum]|uniref:PAS domain-containing protein n=1 Tax=Thalassobaculum fulvum TaxID=1633335 RepID=A0A919CRG9_9PROT|nr:PAS domain-containing protein [Thalassobaculum fulvum]GHD59511.1 hypothetical protein GCM10017083_43810 [Thalassobaculum fulvum]
MNPEDETWVDPSDAAIEDAADRILAFSDKVDPAVAAAIDGCVREIAWIEEPAGLDEPKLGFLLKHWQALPAGCDGIPDRSSLDVADLVPALGNLLMLEVERDGFDAIYRVYGTAVADRAARDWTGFRVSEMNRTTRTPAALLYRSCYRAVLRRPRPLYTEHQSPPYLSVYAWRRLILPLADGARPCGRFLVCNVAVGRRSLSSSDLEELQRRIQRPVPPAYPHTG